MLYMVVCESVFVLQFARQTVFIRDL